MKDNTTNREANKLEKEILVEKYKTALKKNQFLNELKNGLGAEIRKNPGRVRIIKKPWYVKFMITLKKIFTKF